MNSYVIKIKQPKLTKEERKKLRFIKRLINKEINGPKAAKMLKVTPRQIRNLKREILLNGDMGIIHKNRFNKPINTYDEEIRQDIASTYRKNYKGMNFTQFSKVIQEEKGYTMSRSTIYNILRQKRIRSPQRKRNIKK